MKILEFLQLKMNSKKGIQVNVDGSLIHHTAVSLNVGMIPNGRITGAFLDSVMINSRLIILPSMKRLWSLFVIM